ncbi:hypothetical protein L5515_015295 [Caenorhabditis briggsae]|uniref:MATH domain-containing protein n=1 Tax=Caenorhabditis briggsae TaxID=6238 RepID=A0AAE9EFH9_CAEBR|nr:hypothetical protein L5515_015295 [Caenorhabditis briggsae]
MPPPEKTFVLKHVFKSISEMKEGEKYYSEIEEHFGVPWSIYTIRSENKFGLYLECSHKIDEKWTIKTSRRVKLLAVYGESMARSYDRGFGNAEGDDSSWGWIDFIEWDKMMELYMADDSVSVEIFDVKSEDFRKFLELLYGESSIDESTIEGILHLADKYDAKLAIRKCEKFLMKNFELRAPPSLALSSAPLVSQISSNRETNDSYDFPRSVAETGIKTL